MNPKLKTFILSATSYLIISIIFEILGDYFMIGNYAFNEFLRPKFYSRIIISAVLFGVFLVFFEFKFLRKKKDKQ